MVAMKPDQKGKTAGCSAWRSRGRGQNPYPHSHLIGPPVYLQLMSPKRKSDGITRKKTDGKQKLQLLE